MPVAIPGAKPRAILTMLGLHVGSVVSADALVELLWGEDPPRTAAKALQTHISALRRALGDGFVLTEGSGWTLAESAVDASRYKSAARRGRDAAAAGDTGQAVARFEEALELWRGIPELPDGRRGTSEKTRWIEGHAALVEDRADALLATGRAAEIIGELEAAVADAPLRERRWAQLMLALYRAGRQGEALGAYQRARTLLADELGVDPGPELRRLEAAIVAQDGALETPGAQNVPSVTRAVTFLLTDIEGSTAAWEADAAAMGIALARHDELVEQVVTSRGGRLIKTRGEGDATFSVFERPSAAAAAALELQDAITHEPWALREPMRVRVALHTGEAEFRDGDYFGRAVNRAARLRSLAAGGQILCSGATAELVIDSLPDDVVLADLGTRQLRNLARPEHVFELRLETAEDPGAEVPGEAPLERPGLPAVLVGPGPFVGRGQELERLFFAWQTTLEGGTNAVLIAGEPGVGKTRLAGEWSRQAYDQGALVIYGRCDEDLGAPYQPFAEALRSLVPCLGSSRLRELRGAEALLPLVPALTDVLPDLAAPTRADPDTERYALFDAVVALLSVASASAPVVLILDDLHWAAKPTLLLLRHLLRFGERARVQIIGTYRSTDLDRSHPLSAMLADLHRDGTANRLQLGGLDEEDVTAYVAEAGYNDEELARALASVTGGNPFFLIEALRHVDESGGRWDQSTLPQGVREAVSRRLSRLTTETNKALAAAAVVGSRFALELVERVVGDDLVDPFDEACKAGIVIEEPGGHYRFNHALVRQSLLAELPSVRRMRLHQRIATTLENEPGADDELLAELAHHYFECAWAGNALKAVEYCRRAADQAMARLAYEGAADLYDRALHALEEIDDELPDRDDQTAELLIARCEALLAAGDVTSAARAVSQLQGTTVDSARLAAWATCFDGQLSMLTDPERLDEVEAAVGAAADKLAELGDAAGEAKAHTVRAGCLARLGRIGDCEVALDDALTAARRAREHRRVNAVLANAPLAALWGPNPVPRAGGRCLDVVRLLRITTDSPAVEATSTRCQAVLEAFRGRAAAARRMIDSARRTVTELGLRHALLEVEQFAGIVELVVDDPAAAEPHLRKAYNGFRRMGLDADTAETAALLGRTCLTLGRDAEAEELCSESERLAGHALKPSIAWRTLRARLLSRAGEHGEARRVAEAAVGLAERTDALVDHADACLSLATVLGAAGDVAGARASAERAVGLYERKGAAALAEKAHALLGAEDRTLPAPRETPRQVEADNACVRAGERMSALFERQAWDEIAQMYSPKAFIESRRKVVGFTQMASSDWVPAQRPMFETGAARVNQVVIAVRGERLALSRLRVGSADVSPGAPYDEFLSLYGIDEEGRFDLQVWFDVEDIEAAIAELDAVHARFEEEQPTARRLENAATRVHERVPPVAEALPEPPSVEIDNAAVRVGERVMAAVHRGAWDEVERLFAPGVLIENRRKVVGLTLPSDQWLRGWRREVETSGVRVKHVMVAARGERLALARMRAGTEDVDPGAPYDELLHLYAIDDDGRVALQMFFDVEDIDVAIAELDARFEAEQPGRRRLENKAALVFEHVWSHFATGNWDALGDTVADNYIGVDHRRVVSADTQYGRAAVVRDLAAAAEVGFTISMVSAVAIRGTRLVLARVRAAGRDPEAISNDALNVVEIDADDRIATTVTFDPEDFDAAIAELDARYLAGEAAAHSHSWSVVTGAYAALNRHEIAATTTEFASIDHRRGTKFAPGDLIAYVRATWDLAQNGSTYIETVHELNNLGAVVTHVTRGSSREGFEAEWREVFLLTVEDELLSRCELFDEADVDDALARINQLSGPTPRLENAAIRMLERYFARFAARDWDVMAETLTDDFLTDDRRRVVNAGVRRGRDAEIANMQSFAEIGIINIAPTTIATRGERLVLCRHDVSFRDWTEAYDVIGVVEITDDQISAHVMFDADDIAAAIAELDARYLAGEAATHSEVWSVIAGSYAALNRREPPLTSPDVVNVDHRRETAFGPGDLTAYIRAGWDIAPGINIYVEQVHRLSDIGAVVTYAAQETSPKGMKAEWRGIAFFTVESNMVNRTEVFDETDVDAALARFEQLSQPARRLENAASLVAERFLERFAARDWDALTDIFAADFFNEDRRRVVGAGLGHGRDVEIASIRAGYDLGGTNMTSTVIATRGTRLILTRTRHSGADQAAEGFLVDTLSVVEVNTDNRIAARIVFEPGDTDAAIAELDARYLAGEAASHARTWSAITEAYAGFNRRELSATTPNWLNIDHRRGAAFAPGDIIAYLQAAWDDSPDTKICIEAVHRLNNLGGVVTHVAHGISQAGFDAEWRDVSLLMVEGDLVSRCELFNESDLDAALAKFEQLRQPTPQLENTASRVDTRFQACFAARDWETMAEMLSDGFSIEDRRRVVNMGNLQGRDAELGVHSYAVVGSENVTSTVIATRAQRLALSHYRFSGRDQRPDAFRIEMLALVEIDADDRMAAVVVFDADDIDAAIAELDARYLAGEAAAHARTWSVLLQAYAALNRHEMPLTTADWVNVDHRRGTSFASGEMPALLDAAWNLTTDLRHSIEAVHRLSDLGAVVTNASRETSHEGFDAEWRVITIGTVEGDRLNRCEVFDEADLDAAITRFEELSRPAPGLKNAATRVNDRIWECFDARDWDKLNVLFAENMRHDDRRRMVGAGVLQGSDAQMRDMRAYADIGLRPTINVIATRGDRLALTRARFSGLDTEPQAFLVEGLIIIEIDADEKMATVIAFDPDDVDAAFAELEARYLIDEAADYASTWSAVRAVYSALNRHEYPALTKDSVCIDRRPLVPIETADLATWIREVWEVIPDLSHYVETVRRLSNYGAVLTHAARGTSQAGFGAEWRLIAVLIFEGDQITRLEIFDESDLDAAVASFDELQPQAPRLENAASHVCQDFWSHYAARSWDCAAELLAKDIRTDDRRRVINAGIQRGREVEIANLRALADIGADITVTVIATRGELIALTGVSSSNRDLQHGEFRIELLNLIEIDTDNKIAAAVLFEPDDIDAAFAELDDRYLAGEAAAHARAWSVIARSYSESNRHEITSMTPASVFIDHRATLQTEREDVAGYLRSIWDLMPDISVHIEAVHRLSDLGAVITHAAHGTSQDGFDAEWRVIVVGIVEGNLYTRVEVFDEADLDAATARFEELHAPAPRLQNAATRIGERIGACFAARDWNALAGLLADDVCTDDRRRIVGAGIRHGRDAEIAGMKATAAVGTKNMTGTVLATRGERLYLGRVCFSGHDQASATFIVEALGVVETNADNMIKAIVTFELDDVDAAFEELDARYLAGEAAAHAHTWSVIAQTHATLNRHEMHPTTPDWVNIDHRRGIAFAPGDIVRYARDTFDDMPDAAFRIVAVYRLSSLGAVISQAIHGISRKGLEAEWQHIALYTFEGELVNRCEIFDEADLEAALARFNELHSQRRRLENAAIRVYGRFLAYLRDREWNTLTKVLADDGYIDDHRHVVNIGLWHGRDVVIANLRTLGEAGAHTTLGVIATRGERLALTRICSSNSDLPHGAFRSEMLSIVEIDADERLTAHVVFDPEDLDAAFEELDARYLAGEAAAHAHTWSLVTRAYAALNRRQLPKTAHDWVNIDHRRLAPIPAGGLSAYLLATWDLSPQSGIRIEAVHRLSKVGAVVTQVVKGTSHQGFEAEWRTIDVSTYYGDKIKRTELFDEADFDAALARFDKLNRPPPLENNATRTWSRMADATNRRDMEGFLALTAADLRYEDRRKGLRGEFEGLERRKAVQTMFESLPTSVRVTADPIAIRGSRLSLIHICYRDTDYADRPVTVEFLQVAGVDGGELMRDSVSFDPEDIKAAFEELDTRYLAGEAAAHAHTWSVIMQTCAALNRRELFATTADFVDIDHRPLAAVGSGDLMAYIRAALNDGVYSIYVETVHRLNDLGAAVTLVSSGTSQEGFDGEWRMTTIFAVEGDLVSRCEMFDDTDLDAALARFDELNRPPLLENAATRIWALVADAVNRRDVDGLLALASVDHRFEDRRLGLRDAFEGPTPGRKSLQAMFETIPGTWRLKVDPVAVRGSRLSLTRARYRDIDDADRSIAVELLQVTQVGDDELMHDTVLFDSDDIDGAFEELDARYLAGEAATYAQSWSVAMQAYARANRHELPGVTPDSAFVDHRPGVATEAEDLAAYLPAMWDLMPDISAYIEAVHRLCEFGCVITHAARGTSHEGFDAEWRTINVLTVEGDLLDRVEVYDQADLEAALARFGELNRPG
ncbi:hypothetical protein AWB92_11995 [Mycobacterium sp. IEC1808]|nr:hypothetical protein AWB92_11995 [Mycobacterium sp. IEC1808]